MSDEASPFTSTPTHRRLGQRIVQQISRVISPEKNRPLASNPFAALISDDEEIQFDTTDPDPDPVPEPEEEIQFDPDDLSDTTDHEPDPADDPEPDPAPEPEYELTTSNSIDSYCSIEDNMPALGKLTDVMGTITPNLDPSLADVQNHRKSLANVLSNFTSRIAKGGHSWLVETERGYKKRIGHKDKITDINGDLIDNVFKFPEHPDQPMLPTLVTSSIQLKMYEHGLQSYETVDHWSSEAIKVIRLQFPTGLTDMELEFNMLPADLTARQALDHIEKKVKSSDVTQQDYTKIYRNVFDRKYTPAAAGSEEFFKDMMEDQRRVHDLNEGPDIQDEVIMTCAKSTFTTCGHNIESMTRINEGWSLSNEANKITNPSTHTSTKYVRFQTYYNKELKQLYRNGDHGGVKEQANSTQDLLAQVANLTSQLEATETNIDQLYSNQKDMAMMSSDRSLADRSTVPTTVTTTDNTSGGSSMSEDRVIQLAAAAATSLLQKLNLTGSSSRGGGGGGGASTNTQIDKVYEWTQWLFWCFSCGVNLHHHTRDCPPHKRRTNHSEHLSATRADPQGGLTRKDHLWQMWCHPVTRRPHKSKTGPEWKKGDE